MRKIIALIMALMMTLSFIACATDTTEPIGGNETTAPQETEAPETTFPEETELTPDLPDVGDKYKGTELVILNRGTEVSSYPELWVSSEGINGETINDSVFKRNSMLEEKYGIKIVSAVPEKGDTIAAMTLASQSGDDLYDIALSRAQYAGPAILQGMYYNLYDLPHTNFDNPWWDGENLKRTAYDGKVYWTASDISMMAMGTCHGIIFNRDVLEKYNIEIPYDIVKRDEWTLEKFFTLVKQVSDDNGDGVWGNEDTYGFGSDIRNAMLGTVNTLVVASGIDIFTINSDNKLEIAFMNEATINVLDILRTNLNDKSVKAYQDLEKDPSLTYANTQRKLFTEGHYAFIQGNVRYFDQFIGWEMESEYGIVPMPKLTADQESYYHAPDRNATGLLVPSTNDPADLERISILIEDMAYMSSKTTLPDYYEVLIKLRRARVPELAEMVDIIKNTMVYDLSFLHTIGHTECLHNAFLTGEYASTFESSKTAINTKLETLYASLQALQ